MCWSTQEQVWGSTKGALAVLGQMLQLGVQDEVRRNSCVAAVTAQVGAVAAKRVVKHSRAKCLWQQRRGKSKGLKGASVKTVIQVRGFMSLYELEI